MRLGALILWTAIIAAAAWWWLAPSTGEPFYWDAFDKAEYRWYSLLDRLGTIRPDQAARHRTLIRESAEKAEALSGGDWLGTVYPDKGDLLVYRDVGKFDSLEACRAVALATLQEMRAVQNGDYECGYQCEPMRGSSGLRICKETVP